MHSILVMWVVYDNPIDFPGQFVARKFLGDKPTEDYFYNKSLAAVREWIHEQARNCGQGAPYRMARLPNDDPVIFETWM